MPENKTTDETNANTNGQESTKQDDMDSNVGDGQDDTTVTFEDIINHPDYQDAYRKAIDREVSKAIKSYQKNHQTDVENLINKKVSEEVSKVKFQASLKEGLLKAGVIDTTALIAHLDLKELEKSFDAEKETFKDFDKLMSESKDKMPYLFKQEKQGATGQAQQSFGGGKKEPSSLKEALAQRYKK